MAGSGQRNGGQCRWLGGGAASVAGDASSRAAPVSVGRLGRRLRAEVAQHGGHWWHRRACATRRMSARVWSPGGGGMARRTSCGGGV
jgi:hypothetical protein